MTRSLSDWDREIARKPVRSSFNAGFWIILIVLGLGAVGGVGAWALNLLAQPGRVITQTFDANNMIYNYEWFRDQYADIQGMDPQVDVISKQMQDLEALGRENWTKASEDRYIQLSTQHAGLVNKRTRMVQDYNANASKANRSIFMAGLPESLPL